MRGVNARGLVRIAAAVLAAMLVTTSLAGCGLSRSTSTAPQPGRQDLTGAPATAGPSTKGSPSSAGLAESAIAPAPTASGVNASTIPADQRLIVRDKTLRLEVEDVPGAIDKLRSIAKSTKADITDMQVSTAADGPIYRPLPVQTQAGGTSSASATALNAYLTVRVPVSDFERFVDEASKVGRVLYQSESSDDVTQQHVDMAARLSNLRAEETRLRDFLNAARNVTEMLQVETELNRVRGEIESMSAQLAYLERQAALATVTIELTEPRAIVRPAGIDWGWSQALTDAIRAFVGVVEGIIVVTGALLPLVLLALVAFFIIRATVRRSRKRRAAAGTGAEGEDRDGPVETFDDGDRTASHIPES